MSGTFKASRTALGLGAIVAIAAAIPAAAAAASHHATDHHHASYHAKRVELHGLVTKHNGRHVSVFAKTAKAGARTTHNKSVAVTFARGVRHSSKLHVGDRIHISATAHVSGHRFMVTRRNDETVTPAPASLIFGTVDAVNGNLLVLSERNRDDGDHGRGGDRHHGDPGDNDARMAPADHSPGGPGDGGNSGHQVVIDDTNASITVDGSTDTALAVGDTVAVLGEYVDNTVVAADVFGFTAAPTFVRGEITAIDNDTVTVGDDNDGEHGGGGDDATPADHGRGGDDDQPISVSLTGVPLALNGDEGATTGDLTVGDKLILIGTGDATSADFIPELGFAFNSDDHNPCGHNGGGDDGQGHRHDG
jgi:hypothetical protein